MNPPLKIIMHCTDAGTTSPSPGAVVNRFNLNPLQAGNPEVTPPAAGGQLSGNFNVQGLNDEAAALIKGGRKYEVTITELP